MANTPQYRGRTEKTELHVRVVANIRERRERMGWSQNHVALAAKIAQPSYCNFELARDAVKLITLEKIAKVFKCEVVDFFTVTPKPETIAQVLESKRNYKPSGERKKKKAPPAAKRKPKKGGGE